MNYYHEYESPDSLFFTTVAAKTVKDHIIVGDILFKCLDELIALKNANGTDWMRFGRVIYNISRGYSAIG